ncbi:hypothetical protein [Micromonospora sp. SH-82]|uniref:hypothetical protein n=1 Tax=Micromonospora sp. SH-82 TaxID=3132938 RepID=UPI003EBC0B0E
MARRRPGRRRLCLVMDMEGYSHLRYTAQLTAQERLGGIVRSISNRARLHLRRTLRQDQGDGVVMVLPTDVDEPVVLASLLLGLRHALHVANGAAEDGGRIRLRAAVSEGVVHEGSTGYVGQAVVEACRVVDSAQLKAELKGHDDGDLAVAFTEGLFVDVVERGGYPDLPATDFRPLLVETPDKKFAAKARVTLPPRGPVPPVPSADRLRPRSVAVVAVGVLVGVAAADDVAELGERLAGLLDVDEEPDPGKPVGRSHRWPEPPDRPDEPLDDEVGEAEHPPVLPVALDVEDDTESSSDGT